MNSFDFDMDLTETQEWLDAFYALILDKGQERAGFIIKKLLKVALINNCNISGFNTDYRNTIANDMDVHYPGHVEIERKILAAIRWNAIAMVVKANRIDGSLGGHLSTYASAAVLYEVG
ncbi:MAG: pyruvate dehydrogenase (acetyl-transferring), homodimeric type, partial [Gammaproteobacteria bacterium]